MIRILEESELTCGEHEILRDVAGFKYTIKIVVSVENDAATVITCYPLKKGRKQ